THRILNRAGQYNPRAAEDQRSCSNLSLLTPDIFLNLSRSLQRWNPTRNHFSHHPLTCTEGPERTKSELGEHCLSSSPQERTRVWFPSSVDRISVNRTATLGGDDATRALQGSLPDSP